MPLDCPRSAFLQPLFGKRTVNEQQRRLNSRANLSRHRLGGGGRRKKETALEGSRFGAHHRTSQYLLARRVQPDNVIAGGSRELPSVHSRRAATFADVTDSARLLEKRAVGSSREPLALNSFRSHPRYTKYR